MTTATVEQGTGSGSSARRESRWDALRTLWAESSLSRVRNCRRAATDSEAGVVVRLSPDGRAGLGGVQTCGSVWACPCCSAKVNSHRAGEIAQVLEGHRDQGGSAVLVTLTARHNIGHSLASTWDAIASGWRSIINGRNWKDDKEEYGIDGYVRVVEVTYGWVNGWHVHVHAVLLTSYLLDEDQRQALADRLWDRWARGLASKGYTASKRRGVDVQPVRASGALGEYFTKATYELTGAGHKVTRHGNHTPFGLLSLVVEDGDADALAAWHEFERASKGRRQLTWSRGLRARYIAAPELTDEEAAALVDDGETVVHLSSGAYSLLAVSGDVPHMLWLAEHSVRALWAWLDVHGVYYDVPDRGRVRAAT